MQRRFESDPLFQATALLLQERMPKTAAVLHRTPPANSPTSAPTASGAGDADARLHQPRHAAPEVQLLSNGRYHVMVTNAGGGYSRWKDLAVTRWREDTTCDNWGTFCYLRDAGERRVLVDRLSADAAARRSATRRSSRRAAPSSAAATTGIETHTEIAVSPEDDIELRRVRITNRSRTRRTIEVTSYAEVVLAPPAADALHPAFSNLFVQTEILRERPGDPVHAPAALAATSSRRGCST